MHNVLYSTLKIDNTTANTKSPKPADRTALLVYFVLAPLASFQEKLEKRASFFSLNYHTES